VTAINAAIITKESDAIDIAGAQKITFVFTLADHATGNTIFDVDVSHDGTNYADYAMLVDNVANTNSQTLTRVASKTLSANGSATLAMDLQHFGWEWIKVKATRTTDGTQTAVVLIEY
jgi:hypothetical protein